MLRNLRSDLHMFLDNIELRIENKNLSLGKSVLHFWSQICGKMAEWVHKMVKKKGFKN